MIKPGMLSAAPYMEMQPRQFKAQLFNHLHILTKKHQVNVQT